MHHDTNHLSIHAAFEHIKIPNGEHGDGFVRIGLVENGQRIRQAVRNIKNFLRAHGVNADAPQ